jgi:hypothetical protein
MTDMPFSDVSGNASPTSLHHSKTADRVDDLTE